MAKQSIIALCSLAALLFSPLSSMHAIAQEHAEERVFNLVVGLDPDDIDMEIDILPPFIPAIEPGTLDLTFSLGYFQMDKTLLKHHNMIYKATDEFSFYGNVELKNQTGFNPMLRLGYTLTTWLALEAQTGVTFSQYQGTITKPHKINPVLGIQVPEEVELGEFDEERRSTFIWINNLSALWYPLNMDGDGRGRLHPFLIGSIGHAIYEIDSSYTDKNANGLNVSAGVGLALIADRLITLRAELMYQHHQIQFQPADTFDERNEGMLRVPVYTFNEVGQASPVSSYSTQTMSGLTMQLGFSAKF